MDTVPYKAHRLPLVALLLLAFFLATFRLDGQSLWYDEGVTAQVAQQGIAELTRWTAGDIQPRAQKIAIPLGLIAAVLAVVFLLWTQLAYSDKAWTWALVVVAALAWVGGIAANYLKRDGWAFLLSAVTLAVAVAFLFSVLYPNLMPSTVNEAYSLTIENGSSTEYTLRIMTIVAVIFTPIVLAYQSWTYWIFRKRIGTQHIPDPIRDTVSA